ncbi:unnamed protein product [Boreogadus saida]
MEPQDPWVLYALRAPPTPPSLSSSFQPRYLAAEQRVHCGLPKLSLIQHAKPSSLPEEPRDCNDRVLRPRAQPLPFATAHLPSIPSARTWRRPHSHPAAHLRPAARAKGGQRPAKLSRGHGQARRMQTDPTSNPSSPPAPSPPCCHRHPPRAHLPISWKADRGLGGIVHIQTSAHIQPPDWVCCCSPAQ